MKYLKPYAVRHAISISSAIIIAGILNHYIAFSKESWMILSAFLVGQSTRGSQLRQGIIFFATLALCIFISAILIITIQQPILVVTCISSIFLLSMLAAYFYRPLLPNQYYVCLYFALLMSIFTLAPTDAHNLLQGRLIDCAIGAFIGMLCVQIVLPVKLSDDFSDGVLPLLNALQEYAQVFSQEMTQEDIHVEKLTAKIKLISYVLYSQEGKYPEWVYEVGFNPGLRAGFRFFLINVERVLEIFYSLDALAADFIAIPIATDLGAAMANAMQKNAELIAILSAYFQDRQLKEVQSDFTSDIAELETVLRRIVPDSLEALDLSRSFILFTAVVRDLKDMRGLLLQLVMALPATASK